MWIFLLLGGINYLANGNQNIPFFEALVATFNSRSCYLMFGSPLSDPRCREYILYCAFMAFVLTLIQVHQFFVYCVNCLSLQLYCAHLCCGKKIMIRKNKHKYEPYSCW